MDVMKNYWKVSAKIRGFILYNSSKEVFFETDSLKNYNIYHNYWINFKNNLKIKITFSIMDVIKKYKDKN